MSTAPSNQLDQPSAPSSGSEPSRRGSSGAWSRPAGWSGWWSERYARLLARTFALDPPLDATATEMFLEDAPPLFRETLDPSVSAAEPIDRDGNPLPWRYERSLVRDIMGTRGFVFAGIGLAIALSAILLTQFNPQKPLDKPATGNEGTLAPNNPAPPKPVQPHTPVPQVQGSDASARAVDQVLRPELNPKGIPLNAQQDPKSDAPAATAPTAAPEKKVAPAATRPPNSQNPPLNTQRDPKSDAPAAAAPTAAPIPKVPPAAVTQPPNLPRPPPDLPRVPQNAPNASGSAR